MKKPEIMVDTNVFINVWEYEVNPATGAKLWEKSREVMTAAKDRLVNGHICIVNLYEIVYRVHAHAIRTGLDPETSIAESLRDVSYCGFSRIVPEPFMLTDALSLIIRLHMDPYDAVLLATALGTEMDAIVSRDKKLAKKAAGIVVVVSPEEFIERFLSS